MVPVVALPFVKATYVTVPANAHSYCQNYHTVGGLTPGQNGTFMQKVKLRQLGATTE